MTPLRAQRRLAFTQELSERSVPTRTGNHNIELDEEFDRIYEEIRRVRQRERIQDLSGGSDQYPIINDSDSGQFPGTILGIDTNGFVAKAEDNAVRPMIVAREFVRDGAQIFYASGGPVGVRLKTGDAPSGGTKAWLDPETPGQATVTEPVTPGQEAWYLGLFYGRARNRDETWDVMLNIVPRPDLIFPT